MRSSGWRSSRARARPKPRAIATSSNATFLIGPIAVRFQSLDPTLIAWSRELHQAHEHAGEPDISVTLGLADEAFPKVSPPRVARSGFVDELRYIGWRGRYDDRTCRCEAWLSATSDSLRGPRRIASLARTVVSRYLHGRGGTSVHAAALLREGRAFLFVGRSGAGKTTVARTWPGDGVLGDDYCILTAAPEGGFRVHGTPYSGREGTPNQAGSAPLGGILLLHKAAQTLLEPLPISEAVYGLIPSVIHFGMGRNETEVVLSTTERVARAAPVWRLHFDRTTPIWPRILLAGGER